MIVFHAFTGRTEFDNGKARDLAKVSSPHIFLQPCIFSARLRGIRCRYLWKRKSRSRCSWKLCDNGTVVRKSVSMDTKRALQKFYYRTTILRNRIMSSWNYVKALPFVDTNRIGSIGFCFGGLCTLDLARFNVGLKAAVSFHGTLTDYPGNGT